MLLYIDNYPPHKKYISLFPKEDSDLSKSQRAAMMDKILKTIEAKNKVRIKEIMQMDKEDNYSDEEKIITKKTK